MTTLVWGVGFAIPFSFYGFLFGALARIFAQKWRRSPEDTTAQAFSVGAVRGAIFLAVLGGLLGGSAGYLQELDSAGADLTISFLRLLGLVAALALLFGMVAYFIEWLGLSKEFWVSPGDDARRIGRETGERKGEIVDSQGRTTGCS
jgi:hypothetical protein